MHATHIANRKPKSDSTKAKVIEGLDTSDWDALLLDSVGQPNRAHRGVGPEVAAFVVYAYENGYTFTQIASAVKAQFNVVRTPRLFCDLYHKEKRRLEQ